MREIVLISHDNLALGMKQSIEMIVGSQEKVHAVTLKSNGDTMQFETDLREKIQSLSGEIMIFADLLGGTPCNVAVRLYHHVDHISIFSGMNLPLVMEAILNDTIQAATMIVTAQEAIVNVKQKLSSSSHAMKVAINKGQVDYPKFKGQANIVNVRIDERLIHGQVAGIWSASLGTQRIIVANDEAAADLLQKKTLRMAAPSSMRLSVLPVVMAAKYINEGKYGNQRIFLLFKNPSDVLQFIKVGGKLTTVNVGNMSYKEGTTEITKSIQVLPEEERIFQEIAATGINLTAQLVPNDPILDFMRQLETKYK